MIGRVGRFPLAIFFANDEGSLQKTGNTEVAMGTAVAIILKPLSPGWALVLTDGRELARFRGPWARLRALRYLRMLER